MQFALSSLTRSHAGGGRHTSQQRYPRLFDEPEWMRHATLAGVPAGSALFRDNRCWVRTMPALRLNVFLLAAHPCMAAWWLAQHGGTPNLSRAVRALPNVEYVPRWRSDLCLPTMPHEVWERLTPHGQRLCSRIRAPRGMAVPGAGLMHPVTVRPAFTAFVISF